jgi:hypothetical protein
MRRQAWTKGVDSRDVHWSLSSCAPKGQKELLGERPAHPTPFHAHGSHRQPLNINIGGSGQTKSTPSRDQFCGAVRTIYRGTVRLSRSLPSCLPTTEAGYD